MEIVLSDIFRSANLVGGLKDSASSISTYVRTYVYVFRIIVIYYISIFKMKKGNLILYHKDRCTYIHTHL